MDEPDIFCMDFSGDVVSISTNQKLTNLEESLIEIDLRIANGLATKAHSIVDEDLHYPFVTPPQLSGFLGYAISGLTELQSNYNNQINQAIFSALNNFSDPPIVWYDPASDWDPQADQTNLYHDDQGQLFVADFLVVNHQYKADGIGMLVSQAAHLGIPIISLIPQGSVLSAMYDGLPGRTHERITYASLPELKKSLRRTFSSNVSKIRLRSIQRAHLKEIDHASSQSFCRQRMLKGLSLARLSEMTGFSEGFLFRFERDPGLINRLTIPAIWNLCGQLGLEPRFSASSFSLVATDQTPETRETVRDSLTCLIQIVSQSIHNSGYSQQFDAASLRACNRYLALANCSVTREANPQNPKYSLKWGEAEWLANINEDRGLI